MSAISLSLTARRWRRFKQNKRGFYSLIFFLVFFLISLFAEAVSNDKPFLVIYDGNYYFPSFYSYPETTFGGDFDTEADYRDPVHRCAPVVQHEASGT